MRVVCRHGHFAFYPRRASDIAEFSNKFDYELERENDYFTFAGLAGAENYSILGKTYLNLPALTTFEGSPWDVMRENNFVYSLALGLIIPKLAVIGVIEINPVDLYFMSDATLIQPGLRSLLGQQILSYSGEIYLDKIQMRITEFDYE